MISHNEKHGSPNQRQSSVFLKAFPVGVMKLCISIYSFSQPRTQMFKISAQCADMEQNKRPKCKPRTTLAPLLPRQSTDLINDIYFIFALMVCYGLTLECPPQAHTLKIWSLADGTILQSCGIFNEGGTTLHHLFPIQLLPSP